MTEASIYGEVFYALRDAVQELLPEGVQPIRATLGGKATVMLSSVEYHYVGVDGIEPYNAFSVIFPVMHGSTSTILYLSALYRATNGYMWYLPVTTESTKAQGVDIGDFQKENADITHENDGRLRQTTVTIDGQRAITLNVRKPQSVPIRLAGYSYTVLEDDVPCVPIDVDAAVCGWPFSDSVSVTLCDHPR